MRRRLAKRSPNFPHARASDPVGQKRSSCKEPSPDYALAWPEPGPRARIVRISGSPEFDRHRGFAGFRGFGVFTGEAAAAPPPPPAPEVEKAPAPARPEPEPEPQPQPPPPPRSRGEIVVLRPPQPPSGNVVPIRPGALGVLTSTFEDDDPAHAGDSVELSTRERDAFREIARALGVRGRVNHEGEAPA